jgi:hypothetical protein
MQIKYNILTITCLLLLLTCTHGLSASMENDPEPPSISRVSIINAEGTVLIEWLSSPTPGISFYELNEYTPTGSFTFDEIINPALTRYFHTTEEPNLRPFSYDMRAVKISGSDTSYSILSGHHTTIHKTAQWDSCSKTVELNWTPYMGWQDGIEQYRILFSDDDPEFRLAGTVSQDINSFLHSGVDLNKDYCYQVEAVNFEGLTSGSNITCINTKMAVEPEWINADYATVEGNMIELRFTVDPRTGLTSYSLLRSDSKDTGYTELFRFTGQTGNSIRYTDNTAETNKVNYYRLESMNFCNLITTTSNIASNIVLTAEVRGFDAYLEWSGYHKWLGNTDRWNIYRTNATGNIELFQTIGGDAEMVIDDLEAVHKESLRSEFCYFVEALEGTENPFGIKGISRSNIECIHLSSGVFLPNAFTPGENREFYPVMLFEPLDYLLIISDRYGNKIFESRTPDIRWNGKTISGGMVKEGVYLYYLRTTTPNNESIQKKGHVVLFYP